MFSPINNMPYAIKGKYIKRLKFYFIKMFCICKPRNIYYENRIINFPIKIISIYVIIIVLRELYLTRTSVY